MSQVENETGVAQGRGGQGGKGKGERRKVKGLKAKGERLKGRGQGGEGKGGRVFLLFIKGLARDVQLCKDCGLMFTTR